MKEDLPPFSEDETVCMKCGHTSARTEYRPLGQCIHFPGPENTFGFEPNERLHRECRRCGYSWDEAVVVIK